MTGFNVDYIVTRSEGGKASGAMLRPSMGTDGPGQLLPFGSGLNLVVDTGTKWKRVKTKEGKEGFVSDINLTRSPSPAVARLIAAAAHYWREFDYGNSHEKNSPYREKISVMWDDLKKEAPATTLPKLLKSSPNVYDTVSVPWSAVGMSAFIRKASDYRGFKPSAGHADYINASIKQKDKKGAPFWGMQLKEAPIRVGDLVVQWRPMKDKNGKTLPPVTYESAVKRGWYSSHTDVVCEIRSSYLLAMGCNNTHSVRLKKYNISPYGYLLGKESGGNNSTVFMFMRNVCPY